MAHRSRSSSDETAGSGSVDFLFMTGSASTTELQADDVPYDFFQDANQALGQQFDDPQGYGFQNVIQRQRYQQQWALQPPQPQLPAGFLACTPWPMEQSDPNQPPWNHWDVNATQYSQIMATNEAAASTTFAIPLRLSNYPSLSNCTPSQGDLFSNGPPAPSTGDGVSTYSDHTASSRVCCGQQWKSLTLYDRHRNSKKHFRGGSQYQCKCGNQTARKDNYERHLKKVQCIAKTEFFACRCGKQTRDLDDHSAHVQQCGNRRPGRHPNRLEAS